MSKHRCPNCRGQEWFPGAACWDCGWESEPDAQGHVWSRAYRGKSAHERLGIKSPCCLRCGYVQRADGGNSKCPGMVHVGLREDAP